MLYRNTKTGATVDVNSKVSGDWEIAETPKTAERKRTNKPAEDKKKK